MQLSTDEQQFLQFYYPEIKDLCKHFLTLISATLVFSVTFSEKIIDFAKAPTAQRVALLSSFFLLIAALGLCGVGLYTAFMAAEQAAGSVIVDYGVDYRFLARRSYTYLDLSGLFYGAALLGLVAIASRRLLSRDPIPR